MRRGGTRTLSCAGAKVDSRGVRSAQLPIRPGNRRAGDLRCRKCVARHFDRAQSKRVRDC